jgi:hypothetical protein
MKSISISYPIYDLSNPHFQNVEILTDRNEILKGQFVQIKVVKDKIEYLYPSEKFCFLPEENKRSFWDMYKLNNGEFNELPKYIKQLGLNNIIKLTILPVLVV